MLSKINFNLNGVQITNELISNFGASERSLGHSLFLSNNFICSRQPNGVQPLTLNVDFVLLSINERIQKETGRDIYQKVKILTPAYQTGNLYFSYLSVGDYVDANDINSLITFTDGDGRYLRISQNLNDLNNKATARTNLDVYSKSETDGRYVDLTTAQTINGIKTFGSIPILPASNPTTANQSVRKQYVDDQDNLRLAISQNLNDLNNKATARTNLDVYSKSETFYKIPILNSAWTNFVINTWYSIGTGLTSIDNVFVFVLVRVDTNPSDIGIAYSNVNINYDYIGTSPKFFRVRITANIPINNNGTTTNANQFKIVVYS